MKGKGDKRKGYNSDLFVVIHAIIVIVYESRVDAYDAIYKNIMYRVE